jgi:hypothetical protein
METNGDLLSLPEKVENNSSLVELFYRSWKLNRKGARISERLCVIRLGGGIAALLEKVYEGVKELYQHFLYYRLTLLKLQSFWEFA